MTKQRTKPTFNPGRKPVRNKSKTYVRDDDYEPVRRERPQPSMPRFRCLDQPE